jgi:U4/U6 small nuclear ribonucleoprotein PRP31
MRRQQLDSNLSHRFQWNSLGFLLFLPKTRFDQPHTRDPGLLLQSPQPSFGKKRKTKIAFSLMSAEDLLADLDELPSDDDEEQEGLGFEEDQEEQQLENDDDDDNAMDEEEERATSPSLPPQQVVELFQLLESKHTRDILQQLDNASADDGYKLVVQANQLAADVDSEVLLAFKHVRDIYCKRFPELEGLVPSATDYLKAVRVIGNVMDLKLEGVLPPSNVMMIVVTASTSSGLPLTPEEFEQVQKGCDYALALDVARKKLHDFVTSKMNIIAPNLSVLVGSSVAAKLMGTAGGLLPLSRMPACNVALLGSMKKTLAGLSSSSNPQKRSAFLYQCDLITGIRPDLRVKAQRIISAK